MPIPTTARRQAQDALAPLPPSAWDEGAAAHLLRRAGFGGRPEELAELVDLGPEAAVARLVDFPTEEPELEREIAAQGSELELDPSRLRMGARDQLEVLRAWWIFRLAHTRHPLREKLVLHWHDHFACAASKVVHAPLLLAQNQTFRRLGAGRFRVLLGAQARDPAMLAYLDGRLNNKGHPNENWAREVLELFTLGVDRYTQRDVSELARVFTGWTTPHPNSDEFVFRPEEHDGLDKQLFGVLLRGRPGAEGIAEGEEALDRIVARQECASFLAGRLLAFFAGPAWPDEVQEALATELRAHELETRAGLRALFLSRWFHAPEQRFARHRSGVELAIAAVRLAGVQNAHLLDLATTLRRLGMDLFEPPSVAGWPEGRAWVQTGALIERWRLARRIADLPHTRRTVRGSAALDLEAIAPDAKGSDEELLDAAAARILQHAVRASERKVLLGYLSQCAKELADAEPRDVRRAKLRGLVQLLVAAPQFGLA